MNLLKILMATAALSASVGVYAQVTGALGGGSNFLSLSLSEPFPCAPCTLGPGAATIVGGTTYDEDLSYAHVPAGSVFQNRFLAAGATSTNPSTMTFTTPTQYISFLWGSPETYNVLITNYLMGATPLSASFTAASLGFPVINDPSFSQYVHFSAAAGTVITSLQFRSSIGATSIDAFEVTNFSVTRPIPIPEPEIYALMFAGLGALGFFARRRKRA
ncbi:MAG TPA: PEP-CTERM sorting domain-containing protein [Casimicrobiaceae bacterium]|nr:PEP-CTERM sorting domain-containing protein [Casimicrobiaceae bacterium]